VDKNLLVQRLYLTANRVTEENTVPAESTLEQLDLFTDQEAAQAEKQTKEAELVLYCSNSVNADQRAAPVAQTNFLGVFQSVEAFRDSIQFTKEAPSPSFWV